jgi:hypothetical protein
MNLIIAAEKYLRVNDPLHGQSSELARAPDYQQNVRSYWPLVVGKLSQRCQHEPEIEYDVLVKVLLSTVLLDLPGGWKRTQKALGKAAAVAGALNLEPSMGTSPASRSKSVENVRRRYRDPSRFPDYATLGGESIEGKCH